MNEQKFLMKLSGAQMATADVLRVLIATHPDRAALRAAIHAEKEGTLSAMLGSANSKFSEDGIDGYQQQMEYLLG